MIALFEEARYEVVKEESPDARMSKDAGARDRVHLSVPGFAALSGDEVMLNLKAEEGMIEAGRSGSQCEVIP